MGLSKLQVFNTLSRSLEPFEPLQDGNVSFYVCGVTVYDYCHLGHARAYVAFDAIRRYLEYVGYDVTFVQNFTDIDDKIITRAQEKGISIDELTGMFIESFHEDMSALNIKKATKYPYATKYVGQMIALIKGLIEKGAAYVADNGDVCFSIESCEDYGKLSKKVLEDLEAGSRVDVVEGKRSPLDFVLWKQSKPEEPSWDSPWGKGRPGWHIECSAMALKELGETIDIHAGGADLIFPHHENEIAQSECFTGHPLAKYWLHNGFVTIDSEKMSKSLNNFFTIRDILKEYDGEVVRFFLMKMHYRSPLNYSLDGLKEAAAALKRFHTTLKDVTVEEPQSDEFETLEAKFHEAMCDDFNYTEAIGVLFEINKLVNVTQSGVGVLRRLGELLGLFYNLGEDVLPDEVQQLIEARTAAKKNKDFQAADEIRDRLINDFGISVKDTPDGVKWERVG